MLIFLIGGFAFAIGLVLGRVVRIAETTKEQLVESSVPIAALVSDFESFARGIENGALSTEADEALKVLKAHAEQKYLKAPEKKKDRPTTFPGKRDDDWADIRCFEKEMEHVTDDDERIIIIRRWMTKYKFTQAWQTWCINGLKKTDSRSYLRNMFDSDNEN